MANTTSTNSFAPLPGSASRTALMAFTCFVKLPPELRVMIWEVVANRNVDIRARGDDPEEDLCTAEVPPLKFWTTQPVPGVLHANQEARQVGLKFYELSFGAQRFPGDVLFSGQPRIYCNFAADRICLMEELWLDPQVDYLLVMTIHWPMSIHWPLGLSMCTKGVLQTAMARRLRL